MLNPSLMILTLFLPHQIVCNGGQELGIVKIANTHFILLNDNQAAGKIMYLLKKIIATSNIHGFYCLQGYPQRLR